jgi:AraC-like DNA-binding protein
VTGSCARRAHIRGADAWTTAASPRFTFGPGTPLIANAAPSGKRPANPVSKQSQPFNRLTAEHVVGRRAVDLTERLRAATHWAGRFGVIDDTLLQMCDADVRLGPEVAEAWRLISIASGRRSAADIARRVGWSSRHLGERFRAEIGLTPKEASRVVRFHATRRILAGRARAGRALDLAGLAADGGCYDQSHMTREWRSLSGLPPSTWVAAEFGFVQDSSAEVPAESVA